jgi:hypothetical protein
MWQLVCEERLDHHGDIDLKVVHAVYIWSPSDESCHKCKVLTLAVPYHETVFSYGTVLFLD